MGHRSHEHTIPKHSRTLPNLPEKFKDAQADWLLVTRTLGGVLHNQHAPENTLVHLATGSMRCLRELVEQWFSIGQAVKIKKRKPELCDKKIQLHSSQHTAAAPAVCVCVSNPGQRVFHHHSFYPT